MLCRLYSVEYEFMNFLPYDSYSITTSAKSSRRILKLQVLHADQDTETKFTPYRLYSNARFSEPLLGFHFYATWITGDSSRRQSSVEKILISFQTLLLIDG